MVTAEKFVVRLLDADGHLLSWAEVWARPEPQRAAASCPFWPTGPTQFVIERGGVASEITVHWCDLDVARRREVAPHPVQAGQVVTFTWMEPVWLVPGMRDVPLPPVTVRSSIVLAPAPAALNAEGQG